MTYKLDKDGKSWIGFCDCCNNPFEPTIVDATTYVVDNRKKKHLKMDLTKKQMRGYCLACSKLEDKPAYNIVVNIEDEKLLVRMVGKVRVV